MGISNGNKKQYNKQTKYILLVCPNSNDSRLLLEILHQDKTLDIEAVVTAKDAISKFNTRTFDCIIVDPVLPDMDGWRLSRLIRSGILDVDPDIPIIISSRTYSHRITEATAREFEINAFVNLNDAKSLPKIIHDIIIEKKGPMRSKVLVIEDITETINLIQRFLDQRYDIDIATDGITGLKKWKQGRHDLVLLDIMLPGKSGSDVLKDILAVNPLQTIVIMTAHGSSEKASELMLDGATDFISKPFRARQLRRVCDIALHREDYLISQEQINNAVVELKNSEIRYKRLVESLSDEHFFYTQKPDQVFTYISPSIINVLGYSIEDFSKNHPNYLTDNSKNRDSMRLHRACLHGQTPPPFEVEIKRHNGTICQLEITETPRFDNNDNVIGIDGIARDITSRVETTNQLQTLSNAAFEGILIHQNGTIIEVNKTIEQIFNIDRDKLIGESVYNFISSQYHEAILHELQENRLTAVEAVGIRDGGEPFPMMIRPRQLQFSRRTINVITIEDLTEKHRAEQEKEEIHKQLRQAQKMESIGHLTGGIAHDFNNILASIQGYTELALDMDIQQEKIAEYLQEIMESSERARILIAQMLAFSRGGSSNPKPLEVAPLIKDAVKMLHATLPSSVVITENLPEKLPPVLVDAVQFHQTIMNICINARDAIIDDNGVIEITLRKEKIDKLICSSCHKPVSGEYIVIMISDNGIGMDSSTINSIFDPFYSTKPVGKGTGMGLSVVHGIVHDHGGHIHVQSEPGKGTKFTLAFPVHRGKTTVVKSQPIDKQQTGKGHIMVVDDDTNLAGYLQEMLSKRGFNVEIFIDPCEALEVFVNNPATYDLVLTDQTMPRLPGHKLAQALLNSRPDIPIILCTGYSDVIDEAKSREMKIMGYLQKPVESNRLIQLINSLISPDPLDIKAAIH